MCAHHVRAAQPSSLRRLPLGKTHGRGLRQTSGQQESLCECCRREGERREREGAEGEEEEKGEGQEEGGKGEGGRKGGREKVGGKKGEEKREVEERGVKD